MRRAGTRKDDGFANNGKNGNGELSRILAGFVMWRCWRFVGTIDADVLSIANARVTSCVCAVWFQKVTRMCHLTMAMHFSRGLHAIRVMASAMKSAIFFEAVVNLVAVVPCPLCIATRALAISVDARAGNAVLAGD